MRVFKTGLLVTGGVTTDTLLADTLLEDELPELDPPLPLPPPPQETIQTAVKVVRINLKVVAKDISSRKFELTFRRRGNKSRSLTLYRIDTWCVGLSPVCIKLSFSGSIKEKSN